MAQMPSDADAATAALLDMGGLQSTVEPMSYYDPIASRWTSHGNGVAVTCVHTQFFVLSVAYT